MGLRVMYVRAVKITFTSGMYRIFFRLKGLVLPAGLLGFYPSVTSVPEKPPVAATTGLACAGSSCPSVARADGEGERSDHHHIAHHTPTPHVQKMNSSRHRSNHGG
jgi:hypothetical protein